MGLDGDAYREQASPMCSHLNVGVGEDVTIGTLAETVRDVVEFPGEIRFDSSKPDGTPRKLLDVTRLGAMGWRARIGLREGLAETYEWFLCNQERARIPGRFG
jgi:nucleoside-diphosphate-sugar epimerase